MLNSRTYSTSEGYQFLNCRRLPARLNATEAALVLGFHEHDVTPLVAAKLLTPLGKPAPNAPKYFALVDIKALAEEKAWLDRATKALSAHWKRKNAHGTEHQGTR